MSKPPEPRAKTPSRASIPDDPPKAPAEPLAEVERALSILQGRHPDAVQAERETQAALATKKAEADARALRAGAEEKRRWIWRAMLGSVLLVAAVVGWTQYSHRAARAKAVLDALAPELAPYLSHGFSR